MTGLRRLLDPRIPFCTITYQMMTRLFVLIALRLGMLTPSHVYKRIVTHSEDSKQVLFCTNTSRRRTCPIPLFVHHNPRGIPYEPKPLSPD